MYLELMYDSPLMIVVDVRQVTVATVNTINNINSVHNKINHINIPSLAVSMSPALLAPDDRARCQTGDNQDHQQHQLGPQPKKSHQHTFTGCLHFAETARLIREAGD
jgi:hypothetical protein